MASGLTAVAPWPNVAAASSVGLPAGEILPLNASTPRSHLPPRPSASEAACSPSAPSLPDKPTNAVLHDLAKSTWNGTEPSSSSCEFLNERPATAAVLGQATV